MADSMINGIAALVPMRHTSERVPSKNYRPFHGKPLYHHILRTLLDCPYVTTVLIDTDSPFILEDAAKYFPEVQLVERPQHLRGGEVPMNDVLLYDVTQLNHEWYLQTHSTNPLLKTETIARAIQVLRDGLPEHDSLFSVTRVQTRFWDGNGNPINHDPNTLIRTQDLSPMFEENSNIYIFRGDTLKSRRTRIGQRPLMFEMNRIEAIDIDNETDFAMAEILYSLFRKELEG
ncbi:MAG: acylneuraminate cytidylyltransferase family protein [Candidatus Methylomirabilis sp.]|nr:acylneuraminate cytidylyltransferase family protein [Candidatus Methylomirabilis sp.]